jgi:hypothetical protein
MIGAQSRIVAMLVTSSAATGAVSGGCELAISSDVPVFECDQAPGACPENEVCSPTSGQCVASCIASACPAGFHCDSSGICEPTQSGIIDATTEEAGGGRDGPQETEAGGPSEATDAADGAPATETGPPHDGSCGGLLCPCSSGTRCNSGVCADALTVGTALYAAAGSQSFCTTTCCSSGDCADGSVCFASAIGGNYCVNPVWLQRSAQLGTAVGGATCMSGRDCRSGLCSVPPPPAPPTGTCADTCCTTSDTTQCAAGNVCRFGPFPGAVPLDRGFVAQCGHGGTGPNGSACTFAYQCASELCDLTYGCVNPCRSTAGCSASGESCVYINPPPPNNGAIVAACYGVPGTGAQGTQCTDGTQCATQFCDPTTRQCTDVCFANSDCTKSGWWCRPEQVRLLDGSSSPVLACGP